MLLILQIAIGSALLVACALIHVAVVVAAIPGLRRIAAVYAGRPIRRVAALLSATVMVLLAGHAIQIWLWAWFLIAIGQFETMDTSIYFSIVTYTTLGYGDIVLDPYARIIATFAAITGLITFGVSTAAVIGVLSRLLPTIFGDLDGK